VVAALHHPLFVGQEARIGDPPVDPGPLLTRYRVQVVFAGHDHVYERTKPQKGTVFVTGAGGKMRRRYRYEESIACGSFDQDNSFMVINDETEMVLSISEKGNVVDSGVRQSAAVGAGWDPLSSLSPNCPPG
jgi:hypothetical protein